MFTLTSAGLALIVAALLGLYLRKAVVFTKTATLTVIGDISNEKPLSVLYPGWEVIFWPFRRKKATIPTTQDTHNIDKLKVSCLVHDPIGDNDSEFRRDALGELETKEISLTWKFRFWLKSQLSKTDRAHLKGRSIRFSLSRQLTTFFELVKINADGSLDLTKMKERLKDIIHAELAKKAQSLHLYAGVNFTTPARGAARATPTTPARLATPEIDHMKEVEQIARLMCLELRLPVEIIKLERNSPFEALGPAGVEIKRRTALAIKLDSDVLEARARLQVAIVEVKTAKAKGDAIVVEQNLIAKAYGLTALPAAAKLKALLDLDTLKVYRKMAESGSSQFVIMPDMLGKIGAALNAFTGGTP
jgi:hypothetical protein